MPVAKKDRQALWVSAAALVVSAVAAGISFFGVYHQFWREHHEIYATVLDLSVPGAPFEYREGVLEAQVLFENRGNRSEAIIGAEFGYAIAPSTQLEFSFGGTRRGPGDLSGPIVLAPGETKLAILRERISPALFSSHLKGASGLINVLIKFDHSRTPVLGYDSIVKCGALKASPGFLEPPTWIRSSTELTGPGI